ncbi:unnamed protein product [Pylaiella littoralis]
MVLKDSNKCEIAKLRSRGRTRNSASAAHPNRTSSSSSHFACAGAQLSYRSLHRGIARLLCIMVDTRKRRRSLGPRSEPSRRRRNSLIISALTAVSLLLSLLQAEWHTPPMLPRSGNRSTSPGVYHERIT